jgi:hypothetical protein
LEKTVRGKPCDCKWEQETDWKKTHSRMVRFFGGVLSSLMGSFPLSAMALGFSPLEREEKMWSDGGVCEWICRASQRAILLTERAHWEWWLVGVRYWNTKRQGFLPECEGFSLNSVYGSRIEDFLRILRQGAVVFACSAQVKFPNAFENSEVRIYKQKGIITIQAQKLKFFIYCRKPSIPSTI